MIRWCAYCQTYQGEAPPHDDYSLTHTICARCDEAQRWRDKGAIDGAAVVRSIFDRIRELGAGLDPRAVVDEALDRGIAPLDLLFGVIQPVLYDVGARWERGEATVQEEHEVTRRCLMMYDALLDHDPELVARRSASRPDVFLACAPGNLHSMGLRVVEIYLLSQGFSTKMEIGSKDERALAAQISEASPCVVGLSASLPEHVEAAVAIAPLLGAPVVVGGRGARERRAEEGSEGVRLCGDVRELPRVLAAICRRAGRERPTQRTRDAP